MSDLLASVDRGEMTMTRDELRKALRDAMMGRKAEKSA
jgi:hypothetical protein